MRGEWRMTTERREGWGRSVWRLLKEGWESMREELRMTTERRERWGRSEWRLLKKDEKGRERWEGGKERRKRSPDI